MLMQLRQVEKTYTLDSRRLQALRPVDCDIRAGGAVWIHGRNGSGKTTLLRIIAGQLAPDGGTISHARPDLRVSLLSQSIPEYAGKALTIAEHLALGASLAPPRAKARSTLIRLSDVGLGLENRLDDFVGHLSGGETQVVCLLTILATEPDILCLDEPTAALDYRVAGVVERLLRKFINEGLALVLVTHDRMIGAKLAGAEIDLESDHPNTEL